MSCQIAEGIADRLAQRRDDNSLRQLRLIDQDIDFCSNDYLGLAHDPRVMRAIQKNGDESVQRLGTGSTGSRLISGNGVLAEDVEAEIAAFHRAPAALLFNSGYAANAGILSCIAGAGDTLITDELIHASSIDGVRLSKAERLIFEHNSLQQLEKRLAMATGPCVIGVESVYSMDGDEAPLKEIVELAEAHGAGVIVDEAHTTGIAGPGGRGLVVELGLEERVLARVCTFGKALGLHGAAVLGSKSLKDYLINFSRPFIYSTAPSPHTIASILAVYRLLPGFDDLRGTLAKRVDYFRAQIGQSRWSWLDSHSAIQSLVIPGNDRVRRVAQSLQENGLAVIPIVAPTVPRGMERIRICVHAFNTEQDIDRLFDALYESSSC